MSTNEMTFRIGGEAGQGVESGGAGFAKALARGGLHVFGIQDYMSRVRGGHNFYQIRVSERPLYAHMDDVHLLMALVPETIARHGDEVVPGGAIIYDQGFDVDEGELRERGVHPFPVPMFEIAEQAGGEIMANTAAFGAAAGVTGYDLERIRDIIRYNFAEKGQSVINANLVVAQEAYDYARERYAEGFERKVRGVDDAPRRMLLNGNEAICLGALLGGCRFVSAYPMTPASSIIEWWAHYASEYGLVAGTVFADQPQGIRVQDLAAARRRARTAGQSARPGPGGRGDLCRPVLVGRCAAPGRHDGRGHRAQGRGPGGYFSTVRGL